MNEYIDIKSLVLPDMDDGEQIKMRHPGCPAGDDGRQVLFVKKDGGKHLAFCHHCGQKGVMTGEQAFIRRGGQNLLIQDELHLPPDLTLLRTEQPVEHITWLHQYGITAAQQRHYMIGWSEKWGRTILPVYDDDHGLLAFQRRAVLRGDFGPKYLTTRLRHIKNPVFKAQSTRLDTLVLTEDILSAIKVADAGYTAWSLLGTYMTDSVVDAVAAAGFERALVWLDDDNAAVRRSQKTIRRRLNQVANAHVMRHDDLRVRDDDKTDPKVFTRHEIQTAVTRKLDA